MRGKIYYDATSDPSNPGWVASVPEADGSPVWSLDSDTPEEMEQEAADISAFYCNERVEEWTIEGAA